MAKKYLDEVGLNYFWAKVKAYVDSQSGGGGSEADYVSSQGTQTVTYTDGANTGATATWYYRKWDSGWCECWGVFNMSSSASSTTKSATIPLPFTFANANYHVQGTQAILTNSLAAGGVRVASKTTTNFGARMTLTTASTSSIPVDFYVRGMLSV